MFVLNGVKPRPSRCFLGQVLEVLVQPDRLASYQVFEFISWCSLFLTAAQMFLSTASLNVYSPTSNCTRYNLTNCAKCWQLN